MKKTIILGSRGSQLALKQTEWVISKLKESFPEVDYKVKIIKTKGDKILDVTLNKIGGKGLFVKEIEQELLQGNIDMAVHSMKDVPSEMPEGLKIAAVSNREDPRDVLVSRDGKALIDLPKGSCIGTSSLRRQVQILNLRPDINITPLRGNILTRLDKAKNDFDAIVLAAAGLKRMELQNKIAQYFDPEKFIPAVGQGILGIQTRDNDSISQEMLKSIHDKDVAICLKAERTFLVRLNGGCHIPIGAYAYIDQEIIKMHGLFYDGEIIKEYVEGSIDKPEYLGEILADKILSRIDG